MGHVAVLKMFRYVEERTGNPRYGEIADLFQQGLFYRGEDEEHSKVPASRGARENVSTVVRVSVKAIPKLPVYSSAPKCDRFH